MYHWYWLPEAMFTDQAVQDWPTDYVNNDEQMRFGQAGRLWRQAAEPGSEPWNRVMETLLERDFVLSPTFTAYLTSRDFMRMSRAAWHDEYTLPSLWDRSEEHTSELQSLMRISYAVSCLKKKNN